MADKPDGKRFGWIWVEVALIGMCMIQLGCSGNDPTQVRPLAKKVKAGMEIAEVYKLFGPSESVPYDSLPSVFRETLANKKNGTYRKWTTKDGDATVTVFSEIKDGKTLDPYVEQRVGNASYDIKR